MKNSLYSYLGLMQKSGKLSSGDDTVEIDIKKGRCKLLIIAEDASENTLKRFSNMANYRNIKYIRFGTKEDNGASIGKSGRAVIAIKDEGFAREFINKLDLYNNGGEGIVKSKNS